MNTLEELAPHARSAVWTVVIGGGLLGALASQGLVRWLVPRR